MLKTENLPKNILGIYLFKANSGITLYSQAKQYIQEDMFSAFLSALKGFFTNLDLGGLSSFSSDDYFIYLTSANNVLTALIINIEDKSDRFFTLGYEICNRFYEEYSTIVDDKMSFFVPNKDKFDSILEDILFNFDVTAQITNSYLSLFTVDNEGQLNPYEFITPQQLNVLDVFIVINTIVKKIFIIENPNRTISSRLLYLANKAATFINQMEYKSEFVIRNVSDPWDFERIVEQVSKLLLNESYALSEI